MLSYFETTIDHPLNIAQFLYFCLVIGVTVLWDVYFVKRIHYYAGVYHGAIEEAKTDLLGNSSEEALHYKIEIIKYVLLLAINVAEMIGVVCYELGVVVSFLEPNYGIINNCNNASHISSIDLRVIIASPIASVLISLGQVGLSLSLAFGTCLIKYLDVTYHDINGDSSRFIKQILSFSCITGVFIIVTGSIKQLFILQRIFEPIIQSVYFGLWTKQTGNFYKTLRWRTNEFKVRSSSSEAVKRSIKICYHFAIITSIVGIGFICLILCDLLMDTFSYMI